MRQSTWIRFSVATLGMLGMLFAVTSAQAASRAMTGSLGVINPSTQQPFLFEAGPGMFGQSMGAYAQNGPVLAISVAGTASTTMVGKQVTIPPNLMNFSGTQVRSFPAFGNVAGLTKTFMSIQNQATFMVGDGALASCPGDGCTGTIVPGSGSVISFCPPLNHNTAAPAPGIPAAQIGEWNCGDYKNSPGTATRELRIVIKNSPGAAHFGGTLALLRADKGNVWRVLVPEGTTTPTPEPAEVSRSFMDFSNFDWTPGRPNFQYTPNPGNHGPRILANLNANGAISQTFGCVNPTGTVGGAFQVGVPHANVGNNCSTPTGAREPGLGWGFKMTTGTISGSDFYPFSDAKTVSGTPFAPNFVFVGYGQGFFFTRMGTDTLTGGGNRNIVLLGGGLAGDPASTNNFFRISDLRATIQAPEPAMGLGLVAGALALVTIGRRGRRS
jgi:hypothetical protein